MGLQHLPDELLIRLPPSIGRQDMSSLSKACQNLRRITLPFLYQRIEMSFSKSSQATGESDPVEAPVRTEQDRIWLLARSILQRPNLGDMVDHIRFNGETDPNIQCKPSGLMLDRITDSLGSLKISKPPYNKWFKRLQDGDPGALMLLVILMSQNLKVLELSMRFILSMDLSGIMFDCYSRSKLELSEAGPFLLSTLQTANFALPAYSQWSSEHSSIVKTALHLPQVSILSCELLSIHDDRESIWKDLPMSESVKTLLFKNTHGVNEGNLVEFLKATPHVETFECNFPLGDDPSRKRGELLDMRLVSDALSVISSTLTQLRLTVDNMDDLYLDVQGNCGIIGTVSSLKSFVNLQQLEIPIVFLLGFEPTPSTMDAFERILPASLRYFCLSDALANNNPYEWLPVDWFKRFQCLLAAGRKRHTVPALSHLKLLIEESLHHWRDASSDGKEWTVEWRNMCDAEDICFEAELEWAI